MKTLKHVGEGYSGFEEDGTSVVAGKDKTVEVSDAKAEQLLADFPKEWESGKAAVAEKVEDQEEEKAPKGRGKK